MGSPLDLLNAFNKVREDLPIICQDAMNEVAPLMADLNRSQLNQGLRSTGLELPDYSEASVELFGKRPGPFTLNKTGDFHKEIYYEAVDDIVYYGSKDEKSPMLEGFLGSDIFGITDENKRNILNPEIQKELKIILTSQYQFV